MAKYGVSDQNKVMFYYESGAYGTASGGTNWIGLVTNHAIDENENVVPLRYVAGAGRNVNQFVQTSKEVEGTITYHPQDLRFLKFALGSCVDGGSPTYEHRLKENDSCDSSAEIANQVLPSFQIEDAHGCTAGSVFKRTVTGAMVDTMTLNFPEGEMMSIDLGYTAQNITYASGDAAAVTKRTNRPFLAMDYQYFIGSPDTGTQPYPNVKTASLEIAENLSKPNYCDGNRYRGEPIPTSRDYTFNVTLNENNNQTHVLYDKYFIGGSAFNCEIRAKTTNSSLGSAFIYLSGCELVNMDAPTTAEGENENTLTIRPTKVDGTVFDDIQYWNADSGVGF